MYLQEERNDLSRNLKWCTIQSWVHPESMESSSRKKKWLGKNLENNLVFPLSPVLIALEPPDGDAADQHSEPSNAVKM